MYNVHPKTVQRRLANIGFVWNKSKAVYEYTGEDGVILNTDVADILSIENKTASKKPNTTSVKAPKATNKTKNKSGITNKNNKEMDVIDILLQGNKKDNNRTYRGFYFDNDVLEIIDTVGSGNKSELINQALRKVFEEKGLL